MKALDVSPNFTVEDIHKIREKNYEITKNMTRQEKMDYYNNRGMDVHHKIQKLKKEME